MDCQVVLGGEERPALVLEGPPALTQPARFFIFFLFLFFFFLFSLVFRLFCLFSSAIVSFPGSALRRRRRRKGRLLSKQFCSGLFFSFLPRLCNIKHRLNSWHALHDRYVIYRHEKSRYSVTPTISKWKYDSRI